MTPFKHQIKLLLASIALAATVAAPNAHANTWGFRINPIGALIGLIDANVDIGVSPNVVISPEIVYWGLNFSDFNWKISGYGVSAAYHFNGAFADGWYLGGRYLSYSFTAESSTSSGSVTASNIGAMGGYLWQWENFNMNLGVVGGASSTGDLTVTDKTTSTTTTESLPTSGLGVGIEWKIGWSF